MLQRISLGLMILLLFTSVAVSAFAQSQVTTYGVIQGTVMDDSGTCLPGVVIVLTNIETNFQSSCNSNDRGRFHGVLLPLGPYQLVATLQGYEVFDKPEVIWLTPGRVVDTWVWLIRQKIVEHGLID